MKQQKYLALIYSRKHFAAAAKSLQSCLTLCDPIDGSPPGSPVPGILQATTLEWVAISFSNAWKWKGKVKSLSRVQLYVTPWTAAYQAPPSMGFSRQECWSGVPLPSPRKHFILVLVKTWSTHWDHWRNLLCHMARYWELDFNHFYRNLALPWHPSMWSIYFTKSIHLQKIGN